MADGEADSVRHGRVLLDLVEAVHGGEEAAMTAARRAVRAALGDAAFVDACATIASFSAVVKIADGSGIPLEDYKEEATRELREDLSINDFQS
jgi:hypothetical protein